ncbi:hypothetical protein PMI32_04774, partial [Pseudomonas sp. GM60]
MLFNCDFLDWMGGISVAAVMAAIGFALTASHLEEPQVTKG